MSNRLEENNILTTKKIEEIIEKEKYALKLKRNEILWQSGNHGVRRAGLSFAMTKDEREEYIKCKLSVFYFAQTYCKVKREDGTVGKITLRDYQQNIIKLFNDNRYSILMASRQTGKCISFNTLVNIKDKNKIGEIPIGLLYYNELKKERKLTILEKIKIFLYKIISKL